LFCVPVVRNDKPVGVVCASTPKLDAFSSADRDLISHYAKTVSLVYAIIDLQERAPLRLADTAERLYDAAAKVVDGIRTGQIINTDLRFMSRPETEDERQTRYLAHLTAKLTDCEDLACLRMVGASDTTQCGILKTQSAPLLHFKQDKADIRFVRRNPLGIDVLVTPTDLLLAFTGLHVNRTGILIQDANIASRVFDWFKQYVWGAAGFSEITGPEDFDKICASLTETFPVT
jgi:hypothetical protein